METSLQSFSIERGPIRKMGIEFLGGCAPIEPGIMV